MMNIEKQLQLIKRNTEEIITDDELVELINNKCNKQLKAYVGYEPSGKIHLGHVMTVNKLLDLQKIGFEITILLADVHAYLNKKGTLDQITKIAHYNKKCFIALGLDATKTNFIFGSEYQTNKEYMMNLLKMAKQTTLKRAIRSMDEVGRQMTDPSVSQLIYPIMQSLDIATLDIDIAIGGIDQRKIHMLARENLEYLGFKKPICLHTPIILGLDGKKMSSSNDNFISVDDSKKQIEKKLKKAYCENGNINNNPILDLFKYHIFPRYEHILIERSNKYGSDLNYENYETLKVDFINKNIHSDDLKNSTIKYINEILEPVRNIILE